MPPKGASEAGPSEDPKGKGKKPYDTPLAIRKKPSALGGGRQGSSKVPNPDNENTRRLAPPDPKKIYQPKLTNTRKPLNVDRYPTSDVSQTSSVKSEPTYTRNAKPRYFTRKHYDTSEYTNLGERPKRGVNRTALMLTVGQGGTFSNGASFKEKNSKTGELEDVLVDAALEIGSTKVRHLRSYGAGVDFIGTSECITCLGIYFELKDGRCFCAHVNAWMGPNTFHHGLTEHDPETKEIRKQFVKRMEAHSNEMGWAKNDFKPGPLRLTSTWISVLAYALQDGLREFFGPQNLKNRPHTQQKHGFMIMPRIKSKNDKMQGHFLSADLAHPDDDQNRAPEKGGGRVAYTAGAGWHVHNRNGTHTGYMYYGDAFDD